MNGNNPGRSYSGNVADIHFNGSTPIGTPSTLEIGGKANMGGSKGARSHRGNSTFNNGTMWRRAGENATGAQGGKNRFNGSASGYTWSVYGYFYTGQNGGGGGGNASPGRTGYMPLAVAACYDWIGAFTDTTGDGKSGTAIESGQSLGGSAIDPTGISVSNLSSYAPGGGGGGNLGGYHYRPTSTNWGYYGYAGSGGAAGGMAGFVSSGTLTVNGTIEAKGGNGNPPGATSYVGYINGSWEGHSNSGGGAGSGGTVLLVGDEVNLAPATSLTSAAGATIDLRGGIGGGWRSQSNTEISNNHKRYPSYTSFGNFGGDGGFGRLIVDYKTSFNGGRYVFNKYGHHQAQGTGGPLSDLDNLDRQELWAGTAVARCGGAFDGNTYKSGWIRLDGLNDVVTNLQNLLVTNASTTIEAQGAPYLPGSTQVNSAAAGLSAWVATGGTLSSTLTGYGFVRYRGTFARTSSTQAPVIGETRITFATDDAPDDAP